MQLNYIIMLFYCGALVSGYELVTLLEGTFPPLTIAASRALIAAITSFGFCLLTRQPIMPAFRRLVQGSRLLASLS